MITQLCFTGRVQALRGIDKLIEPTKIIDLRLIRDVTNTIARQAKRGAEMIAEIYRS